MVTTSKPGLDFFRDAATGAVDAELDTIAVGNGTAAENNDDASLANEVYRSSGTNVEILDGDLPGEFSAVINLKGGTQVAGGTTITEMAVIAGGIDLPVTRDVFSGKTIDAGYTEDFQMPLDINEG